MVKKLLQNFYLQTKIVLEQSDDNSSNENVEVIYRNPNIDKSDNECNSKLKNVNTCKILQRKLELKVERAKRNYSQLHEEKDIKKKSSYLIPINRLKIPGCIEEQPLVEYKSDDVRYILLIIVFFISIILFMLIWF